MGESYAGNSGTHKPTGNAVDTTNGAGAHNIQIFAMNPDGTVVHCLPGFWSAQDLVGELTLARKLNDVYMNHELSAELKSKQFAALQMEHIRQHPQEMADRSHLQGFDMKAEAHKPNSDCIKDRSLLGEEWTAESCKAFKTTDVIMHERMSKRPFMTYGAFDVAQFADYGTDTYDKHEDALDESGRMISEEEGTKPKFEPIKNARSIQEARKSADLHAPVAMNNAGRHAVHAVRPAPSPKVYVKTYGRLRTNR